MNIALTVWNMRISPVFDTAGLLLVVRIENSHVLHAWRRPIDPGDPGHVAALLRDMDIEALICGAITEYSASVIEGCGIRLIPFISGKVADVVEAFLRGNDISFLFSMPGRGKMRRGRAGRGKPDPGKESDTLFHTSILKTREE